MKHDECIFQLHSVPLVLFLSGVRCISSFHIVNLIKDKAMFPHSFFLDCIHGNKKYGADKTMRIIMEVNASVLC